MEQGCLEEYSRHADTGDEGEQKAITKNIRT